MVVSKYYAYSNKRGYPISGRPTFVNLKGDSIEKARASAIRMCEHGIFTPSERIQIRRGGWGLGDLWLSNGIWYWMGYKSNNRYVINPKNGRISKQT